MPESRRQRRVQLPPSLRRTAVNRRRNRRNIRFGSPRHRRPPRRSPMRRPPGIQPIQLPRQLLQAVQVMRRQKVVNIRQRRLHPPRQRLVIRRTQQRIQPNQTVAAALQPRHLFGQQLRLPPIPAVGDYQCHGAASQRPPRPAVIERLYRLSNPRAARPVRHSPRHFRHRPVNPPMLQMPRNARQPGRKQKRLHRLPAARYGMDEMQQHPRVPFHRPADIAD